MMLSGWVKRDELVNVSEMMLPSACQTTVCSASSEDGICSLGVSKPQKGEGDSALLEVPPPAQCLP